jgi:hypothetical protein
MFMSDLKSLGGCFSLANNLDVRFRLQREHNPVPIEWVVVDDSDPDLMLHPLLLRLSEAERL